MQADPIRLNVAQMSFIRRIIARDRAMFERDAVDAAHEGVRLGAREALAEIIPVEQAATAGLMPPECEYFTAGRIAWLYGWLDYDAMPAVLDDDLAIRRGARADARTCLDLLDTLD